MAGCAENITKSNVGIQRVIALFFIAIGIILLAYLLGYLTHYNFPDQSIPLWFWVVLGFGIGIFVIGIIYAIVLIFI